MGKPEASTWKPGSLWDWCGAQAGRSLGGARLETGADIREAVAD